MKAKAYFRWWVWAMLEWVVLLLISLPPPPFEELTLDTRAHEKVIRLFAKVHNRAAALEETL
ncbi:MAG: hypothetical protein WC565_09475 [Parcubacteria group bacterium]